MYLDNNKTLSGVLLERTNMKSNERGADLIFLSELPLGVVPNNREEPSTSVTFQLKAKPGKRESVRWTIDAAASLGLPTLVDMQIFVCLMAYTRTQDFLERIAFSRYQICHDLGWTPCAANYDRIRLALDRLQRTSYVAINHYPDARGRGRIGSRAFQLVKEYDIPDKESAEPYQPPSWFIWTADIHALLQTPQLKQIDFDFFRSLESALAQSAYRYLHTRSLDGKRALQRAEEVE